MDGTKRAETNRRHDSEPPCARAPFQAFERPNAFVPFPSLADACDGRRAVAAGAVARACALVARVDAVAPAVAHRTRCPPSATPTPPTSPSAPRRSWATRSCARSASIPTTSTTRCCSSTSIRCGIRWSPRRASSATSPSTSTSASPGSRFSCATRGQRLRVAGRLRRRQPRPDRDHRQRATSSPRCSATRCRTSRSGTSRADLGRFASARSSAWRRWCSACSPRRAAQPRRHERRHHRHAGGDASRASSTSRATSSAKPTASVSR